jgi:hypothetical protein
MQMSIKRCDSVSVLAGCSNLQRLLLEDCRKLTDLQPLAALPALATLLLKNIRNLADLKPVAALPALTTLGLDRCFARDLTPLSSAARLETLALSYDCWAIMGVTFPPKLPALWKLRLMAALQVRGPSLAGACRALKGCSALLLWHSRLSEQHQTCVSV